MKMLVPNINLSVGVAATMKTLLWYLDNSIHMFDVLQEEEERRTKKEKGTKTVWTGPPL